MIIIDKETGLEYEVMGRVSTGATHSLSRNAVTSWDSQTRAISGDDMFLRLVHPRHTFGKVVYEEIGEVRILTWVNH